ncbi:MAG: hypothetical protein JWN18_44 [Parcubacteria group bacterium]|nr:hypothetical protein [Parcubacteria group bacterium]
MTIKDVYKKFNIPPNLETHMLTVAQVVCGIKDHWKGSSINWNFIIGAALLHDVGNIVKFNFDAHPEFLGKEEVNIEYWRKVKQEVITKYGSDDHMASGNMLKEINVSAELHNLIQNKSFSNAVEVAEGNDWYSKILLYADMRVMPHGIATLEERLSDVRNRMPQYTSRPDFESLLDAARGIEGEIAGNLDALITSIEWGKVSDMDTELLNRTLSH